MKHLFSTYCITGKVSIDFKIPVSNSSHSNPSCTSIKNILKIAFDFEVHVLGNFLK
jgi:hypothetical protein